MNKNKITTYQDLWDTGKISAERVFHNTKCFIRKQEMSQICNLIFLLKNLVKEKQNKCKKHMEENKDKCRHL